MIVVATGNVVVERVGTRADGTGVEVVQLRTRRMACGDIASLRAGESRWGPRNVVAELASGERVELVAVPRDDLPLLEQLRSQGGQVV